MATDRLHIPLDRFGRVVLPKQIRDRLGVSAGSEFEVEETEDAILLRPVMPRAEVVDEGGWLVLKTGGKGLTNEDVRRAIEESREERDKQCWSSMTRRS